MKLKLFILSIVFLFGTSFAFSQKYAYIDSDYILSKVQEYKDAKTKLDKLAEMWTAEIEERYKVLNEKKKISQEKKCFCQRKKEKEEKLK